MEAIVAVFEDWGIGAEGTQPLVVAADRARFKTLTGGGTVIVGRKTLADLPNGKPLKNRRNIVLTHRSAPIDGALVAHSAEEAAALAGGDAYVIGGASVYRTLLPYCTRVRVTKIFAPIKSDRFFPNLDADDAWRIEQSGEVLCEDGVRYQFVDYIRAEGK